ncbi:MAG: hypothetical protein AAGA48_35525 [Myxococcota bacterium]
MLDGWRVRWLMTDAVDLATIAYPDDAILRRAALHVEPELAQDIVRYVHAQRPVFNIAEPCSTPLADARHALRSDPVDAGALQR